MRILVVEDEFLLGTAIAAALTTLGFEVVGPVSRVSDAVEAARNETLGGAILDVHLSDEQSWPVAYELLRRHVPIIFASGVDRDGIEEPFRHCPHLQKPFNLGAFHGAVSAAFTAEGTARSQ